MKVRIISVFRDKDTHEVYKVGDEREFEVSRAQHLLSLGLVEVIEKAKPAKEEPKVETPKVEEPKVEEPIAPAQEPAQDEKKDEEAQVAEPESAPAEQKVSRRQHRKTVK